MACPSSESLQKNWSKSYFSNEKSKFGSKLPDQCFCVGAKFATFLGISLLFKELEPSLHPPMILLFEVTENKMTLRRSH